MKTIAILLASGSGSRFGGDVPKQYVEINGRMVIDYTLAVFLQAQCIDEIVIVVSEAYKEMMDAHLHSLYVEKPVQVVIGGASRKESCYKGVCAIREDEAKVLIHNAVQPFITAKTLYDCSVALDSYSAVTVGSPSVYTVLEIDDNRVLRHIVDRSHSVNDLGPECFMLGFIREVFVVAGHDDSFTNINGMVMKYGLGDIYVVDGDPSNIKITYHDDVALAKKILDERALLS